MIIQTRLSLKPSKVSWFDIHHPLGDDKTLSQQSLYGAIILPHDICIHSNQTQESQTNVLAAILPCQGWNIHGECLIYATEIDNDLKLTMIWN